MLTSSKLKTPDLIPGYRHIHNSQHIIRLEGEGNYTNVYLSQQTKPLLTSRTLKYFQKQLPGFIRISKSALVNPAYVEKMIGSGSTTVSLQLADGTRLSISRRRVTDTIGRLEQCFGQRYTWKREQFVPENKVVPKDADDPSHE